MANFTVTTCRFRDGWLVPFRGSETLELDWAALIQRVAPGAPAEVLRPLRMLVPNTFVVRRLLPTGRRISVIVRNQNMSGDVREMAKKDPDFAASVEAVYRVDRVLWEDRMIEAAPASKTPAPR